MAFYQPPQGQAAAYRLGELDAQLRAEREARTRAEQANAYLLSLLTEQCASPASPASNNLAASSTSHDKSDFKLLQQLLEASKHRIETLKLELELEKLKTEFQNGVREIRPGPSNVVFGGGAHTSPTKMAVGVHAEKDVNSKRVGMQDEKTTEEGNHDFSKKSEETDIPAAEWTYRMGKEKQTSDDRARAQCKSYFATPHATAPSQVSDPAAVVGKLMLKTQAASARTTVEDSTVSTLSHSAGDAEVHAPQPVRPTVALENLSVAEHKDETTRFGRFERDFARASRSHGRPLPNPRPPYLGHFPYQKRFTYQPCPSRYPPQPPPRLPFGANRLVSYADLDRPYEAPLPLHKQPSAGYLDFSEDLYDEPPPSSSKTDDKVDNKPLNTTTAHRLTPFHGLQRSIHARSLHWPVFGSDLHSRRHVDITIMDIPSATEAIPALVEQVVVAARNHGFLLAVTPPRKTTRVISPTEVMINCTTTLEFARGDVAATFVRSITEKVLLTVEGGGTRASIQATQRWDRLSSPILRDIGEAIWRCGASRVLLLEQPGAALRVPANLRYQVDHCPYMTSRKFVERSGGGGGECSARLQRAPEFLEDGAIRVVFWDVRDAIVAYRTWASNPPFKNVGLCYEGEGALPELEVEREGDDDDGGAEKEQNMMEGTRESESMREGEVEKSEAEGRSTENHNTTGSGCSSIELEKEQDDRYAAGSSEDMDNSVVFSPRCSIDPKEEEEGSQFTAIADQCSSANHPQRYPNRTILPRIGLCASSSECDVNVNEKTTKDEEEYLERNTLHRAAASQGIISDCDGECDELEEGGIREPPPTTTETALSSFSTLPRPPLSYDQEQQEKEQNTFLEVPVHRETCISGRLMTPEVVKTSMGRSRWAVAPRGGF